MFICQRISLSFSRPFPDIGPSTIPSISLSSFFSPPGAHGIKVINGYAREREERKSRERKGNEREEPPEEDEEKEASAEART
jgi:hypothetical protein